MFRLYREKNLRIKTKKLPQTFDRNLVPRAFSSFKMAVRETPGQGYWNTPRIVEYFVTWRIIIWLFRRLFPASGGPVYFLQSETVIQTKRRHFIEFVWKNTNELLEPLWQPWPGVSPTAILNEEKATEKTRLVWPRCRWDETATRRLSRLALVPSRLTATFCERACFLRTRLLGIKYSTDFQRKDGRQAV